MKGNSKKTNAFRKIKDAEIKEKQFALMRMRLQGHDRVREINLWEKLKKEQVAKADFDITNVNDHQAESYAKKWAKGLEIAKLVSQPDLYRHSKANLETIQKDMRIKEIDVE